MTLTNLTDIPTVSVSKADPTKPYILTTTLWVVRYVRQGHRGAGASFRRKR